MLINLRNALMAGKRLPYDAEVEYLESTGTQWIDTGVMYAVNHSYDVKSDLMVKSANQLNGWNAGGCFGSDSTGNYSIGTGGSVPIIDKYVHSELLINSGSSSQTVANYLVDGVAYGISRTHENLASYAEADGFPLFACKSKGSLTYLGTVRFYACQIYVNSTLVRDYIPVRVGTVGYLYDRVSGKLFGNAGTGDFVLGPDVVPVEYIESHGTEYIDTGVVCESTTKVELDARYTEVGASAYSAAYYLFAQHGGTNARLNIGQSSSARPNFGFDLTSINYQTDIPLDTQRHTFLVDAQTLSCGIDGSLFSPTVSAFGSTTSKSALFARNNNGTIDSLSKARMFKGEIWNNSLPVRSFRPVRVGTDATSWEGAMMDVLTRRIYRNQGTGAFAYGNDLRYPIPAA